MLPLKVLLQLPSRLCTPPGPCGSPRGLKLLPLEVLLRLTLDVYAAPLEVLLRLTLEVYAAPLVVRAEPLEVLLHLPLRSVRRPLMSVWLPKLLPLEVPCAAPFEVPGDKL